MQVKPQITASYFQIREQANEAMKTQLTSFYINMYNYS